MPDLLVGTIAEAGLAEAGLARCGFFSTDTTPAEDLSAPHDVLYSFVNSDDDDVAPRP